MLKAKDVRTDEITSEMIGRAFKVFGPDNKPFYKVQSSRDELVEYSVRWDARKGFTCTCEAGLLAFSRCKDGCCQHVKIAVAASREEKQALAEIEAAITAQAAQPCVPDVATRARIEAANERQAEKPASRAKGTSKAFSLMR